MAPKPPITRGNNRIEERRKGTRFIHRGIFTAASGSRKTSTVDTRTVDGIRGEPPLGKLKVTDQREHKDRRQKLKDGASRQFIDGNGNEFTITRFGSNYRWSDSNGRVVRITTVVSNERGEDRRKLE